MRSILALFTNDSLILKCYFAIVGFIDIELVGAIRGIDDRTSVPFPWYNVRVSIDAGVGYTGSIQLWMADEELVS